MKETGHDKEKIQRLMVLSYHWLIFHWQNIISNYAYEISCVYSSVGHWAISARTNSYIGLDTETQIWAKLGSSLDHSPLREEGAFSILVMDQGKSTHLFQKVFFKILFNVLLRKIYHFLFLVDVLKICIENHKC